MSSTPTIDTLRRYAVARTFFRPRQLADAVEAFGFVQADPIRAPARAQDLILRHRVPDYRAGDLERAYPELEIDEDFFVNYGFLSRRAQALMHPRGGLRAWVRPGKKVGEAVLSFVREAGEVHPRDVDARFAHGAVTNYWGGSSTATTHVLDHLHYRGLLRVARREAGIRIYAARASWTPAESPVERRARQDALVDLAVGLYAPVPSVTLSWLVRRLQLAAPQWRADTPRLLARAKQRLATATVEGLTWFWPAHESLDVEPPGDGVRVLAPFDPLVWDRRRFEAFWGWPYRFEAYTPAPKRAFGYYALPLLWRDQVVGWVNVTRTERSWEVAPGFHAGRPPRDRGFRAAFEADIAALRRFLGDQTRRTRR